MKLNEKLVRVDNSFTVNMYDNGYMVEIGGRNEDENWATARIMCNSLDDLIEIITEASSMPRD